MTDSNEPRKASELLLELESKVNTLLSLFSTIEFNQRVISNKLSEMLKQKVTEVPKFTVESVNVAPPIVIDPEKNIPISVEDTLPMEMEPKGFRRTSRPETYAGDNSHINRPKSQEDAIKFPVQIPRGNRAEVIVSNQVEAPPPAPSPKTQTVTARPVGNNIPVMQRMVDSKGKSIFLGDVNIINISSKELVFKTRTNGTGKWMASLPVGEYSVIMTKRNSTTKEPMEVSQTVMVDGTKSPLELPMCIVKG